MFSRSTRKPTKAVVYPSGVVFLVRVPQVSTSHHSLPPSLIAVTATLP